MGGSASPEDDGSQIATAQYQAAKPRLLCQRVEDNAFHLEDEDGIADANEVFHTRGVPVCQANTAMAGGTANCLGIVRPVNANAGLV